MSIFRLNCDRTSYKKKGCFGGFEEAPPTKTSEMMKSVLVDWRKDFNKANIKQFTSELLCACADAARVVNIKYFGKKTSTLIF